MLPNPTVEMAQAETYLVAENNFSKPLRFNKSSEKKKDKTKENAKNEKEKLLTRRWNDYGIGLLGQMQYGLASEAFRRAGEIDSTDSNLFVNTAIAELQTERYGPERTQIGKAREFLEKAMSIAPENNRAGYYLALVKRSDGEPEEAADILAKLAAEYPNDREVQRQLGQTFYSLGRYGESRAAFLAINRIDPTDAGAFQFLSPLFANAGLLNESEEAQKNYLLWRDDPLADVVANRFFTAHPEWVDVRVPGKIYGDDSPSRPGLTGEDVAAER